MEKFQLILIIYEGTSFTDKQSEQKLEKIAKEDWIDGWSWFLVIQRWFINVNHPAKFELKWAKGSNTSFAKISDRAETCIGSCAQIMIFGAWVGMEMLKI